MEKLQHRSGTPLPDLPSKLIRGNVGSVLSPIVVQPVVVIAPKLDVKKIVAPIEEKLRIEAKLPPKFNADEAIGDPQAAIREWQKLYGKKA